MRSAVFGLAIFSGAIFSITAAAADSCDRACLNGWADRYLAAQASHDPSKLKISSDAQFTENGHLLKFGEGFWKTAGKIAGFKLYVTDPEHQSVAVYTVLRENGKRDPVLVVLRLKLKDGAIKEAETLLTRKAEVGSFFAPENMQVVPPLFQQKIRPAEQDSRLQLMATADGYFRAFETEGTDAYHKPAALPDAQRDENGIRTTNVAIHGHPPLTVMQDFDEAHFKGMRIFDRRYPLVDTEAGLVLALVRFAASKDSPPEMQKEGPAPSTQLGTAPFVAEIFAVTDGKIRQVQALMAPGSLDVPTPFMPAE